MSDREVKAELEVAQKRIAELTKVLEQLEWIEEDLGYECAICFENKNHGHAEGCALKAALGK